jgi:hypothetical protein
MRLRIDKAMDHVTKMFPDLPGGVHALPREEIHLLIAHLGVMDGDTFWEIGVGLPYLAFALSAAAKNGVVLATDLSKSNVVFLLFIVFNICFLKKCSMI